SRCNAELIEVALPFGPMLMQRRWVGAWIVGGGLLLVGCATSADPQSTKLLSDAITTERNAVACKRSIASETRYQNLMTLLPLAAPYQASVVQMTNVTRGNDNEIRALIAWTQDIQKCR